MISTIPEKSEENCQVCIVGSGAAGAVLAYELVASGLEVIVLEEGEEFRKTDFTQLEGDLIPRIYADSGARATDDASIAILQGRCVGGTTVINHGICFRTPDRVLDEWKKEFGIVGLDSHHLEEHFVRVEGMIGARKLHPDEVNANNQVFKRGCEALGLHGNVMTLNQQPCKLCGPCNLGCPEDRKGSTNLNYLPAAVQRGARVFRQCRAERIELEGDRSRAVLARVTTTNQRIRIRAPIIIIAAGAVNSPVLLLRSGFGRALMGLGSRVSLHPLFPLMILSDTPLDSMRGFPHSYYCDAFFDEKDDFLMEGLFVSIGVFASGMGGFGRWHREPLRRFPHLGLTYVQLRDRSRGWVRLRSGAPRVHYVMNEEDRERARRALKVLARICLAGGAQQVMTTHVKPVVMHDSGEVGKLDQALFRPNDLTVFSAHPQGGCPMGSDAHQSVVDSKSEVHGVRGLFVSDASVFPSPVGANPMVSIMAMASLTAQRIVERRKSLL